MSLLETRKHKREALRAEPFEPERLEIIRKRFPYFEKLSDEDQRELLGHVRVFLAEKKFEGCAGLEMTDEIRLTIAAQACLLLLHRKTDYFPECDVILVYPHAYRAKNRKRAGHGVVIEQEDTRLGESHQQGVVVLSWDAVRGGATSDADGHNVVLHEFAHQLDQEDGAADGAPVLERRAAYGPWAKVLGEEFAALQRDVDDGVRSDIDAYGATNPAEFFAVVTETFFEKPERLASNHPELYDQLVAFYKQDPLARLGIAVERKPRAPRVAAPEASKNEISVITCDMSNRARAGRLVKVGEALREETRSLGFARAGFVGTLFEGAVRPWAWVGEVLRGPDATTVGVLYNIGHYGEGLALWTMLENGTLISTETSRVRPLSFRVGRVIPRHHPREHVFVESLGLAPRALVAAHEARVKRIASREKSQPIARDAFALYLAVRIRMTALRGVRAASFQRARAVAFWVVFAIVAAGAVAASFALAGLMAAGQKLGLVVALSCIAAALAGMLASRAVARFATWRSFGGAPIPPSELFARAAEIDDAHAARIEELLI